MIAMLARGPCHVDCSSEMLKVCTVHMQRCYIAITNSTHRKHTVKAPDFEDVADRAAAVQ
jgi:hypothetical protein